MVRAGIMKIGLQKTAAICGTKRGWTRFEYMMTLLIALTKTVTLLPDFIQLPVWSMQTRGYTCPYLGCSMNYSFFTGDSMLYDAMPLWLTLFNADAVPISLPTWALLMASI